MGSRRVGDRGSHHKGRVKRGDRTLKFFLSAKRNEKEPQSLGEKDKEKIGGRLKERWTILKREDDRGGDTCRKNPRDTVEGSKEGKKGGTPLFGINRGITTGSRESKRWGQDWRGKQPFKH